MKTNFTFLGLLAFAALLFISHDLHETAHMVVGRILCGEWGVRDFNNVSPIVKGCEPGMYSLLGSYAGPLVSYLGMWIGFVLLAKKNTFNQQIWGFCFVFANVPFARFFTAMLRGGDEFHSLKYILADQIDLNMIWILNALLVFALILPPLLRAFYFIQAPKRVLIFIGFLILPMLFEFAVLHTGLNYVILKQGILYEPVFFGNPLLVNLLIILESSIFLIFYPKIKTLWVKNY